MTVPEVTGKERPILFSAPMVRALLAGTKTQTRRAVKNSAKCGVDIIGENGSGVIWDKCPHGQPGDRLWVRETHKAIVSGEVKNGYGELRYGFAYQADGATRWQERPTIIHDLTDQPPTGPMQFKPVPWKPSIHMPRRASRITLEIVSLRVERLNDISNEDALAEGVAAGAMYKIQSGPERWAKEAFRVLWESINGAGSWEANPYVWVVEFRRLP